MKHCYTVVTYHDNEKTELECALCHQPQKEDSSQPNCPYDMYVDARSDIRVVNHLVANGWSLHTVLDKQNGLVYVVVQTQRH